ncbi:unnamed protein product [Trichobilharzia szidati]|nr:unnamed protein product [Trichobilharzia szidati]
MNTTPLHPDTLSHDKEAEIQSLKQKLTEVNAENVRLKWRLFSELAHVAHFRSKSWSAKNLYEDSLLYEKYYKAHGIEFGSDVPVHHQLPLNAKLLKENAQLKKQLEITLAETDVIKASAVNEISYLQNALAAESGDHAASVCQLKEELNQAIRVIYFLLNQFTQFNEVLKKGAGEINQLKIQNNMNNHLILSLQSQLQFTRDKQKLLVDRLNELESRFLWSLTTVTEVNDKSKIDVIRFKQLLLMSKHLLDIVGKLEFKISFLENQLDIVKISSKMSNNVRRNSKCKTGIQSAVMPLVAPNLAYSRLDGVLDLEIINQQAFSKAISLHAPRFCRYQIRCSPQLMEFHSDITVLKHDEFLRIVCSVAENVDLSDVKFTVHSNSIGEYSVTRLTRRQISDPGSSEMLVRGISEEEVTRVSDVSVGKIVPSLGAKGLHNMLRKSCSHLLPRFINHRFRSLTFPVFRKFKSKTDNIPSHNMR